MANHGRKLSIFFADGSPTGVRQAEIINWSGQAIVCPRVLSIHTCTASRPSEVKARIEPPKINLGISSCSKSGSLP